MSAASPARLRANARNARKSTGPRTPEGKARSRANGARHGLAGAGVGLTAADAEVLARREAAFVADLRPTDELERALVRQIALAAVRMDRCVERTLAMEAAEGRRADALWDVDRALEAEHAARGLADDPPGVWLRLQRTSEGCTWLIERLEMLASALEDGHCPWTDAEASLVLDLLGRPRDLRRLDPASLEVDDLRRAACCGDAEALAALRRLLEETAAELSSWRDDLLSGPEAVARSSAAAGLTFDTGVPATLLRRYESAHQRAFYRALDLLRSHRARKPASAPLLAGLDDDPDDLDDDPDDLDEIDREDDLDEPDPDEPDEIDAPDDLPASAPAPAPAVAAPAVPAAPAAPAARPAPPAGPDCLDRLGATAPPTLAPSIPAPLEPPVPFRILPVRPPFAAAPR